MPDTALVVMARYPKAGKTKTRLARAIGDVEDADLYRNFLVGLAQRFADGGYYLIAMREPYDVFSGIPMSTSVVRRMTIELAARRGLKVRLLRPLFDIDELPDLLRLAELLHTDSTLAPATAVHLASIRSLY